RDLPLLNKGNPLFIAAVALLGNVDTLTELRALLSTPLVIEPTADGLTRYAFIRLQGGIGAHLDGDGRLRRLAISGSGARDLRQRLGAVDEVAALLTPEGVEALTIRYNAPSGVLDDGSGGQRHSYRFGELDIHFDFRRLRPRWDTLIIERP
ncbi:MAG: hypothetical protein ACFCBW_08760, partial [Candidatus Competibacterales bacterium]